MPEKQAAPANANAETGADGLPLSQLPGEVAKRKAIADGTYGKTPDWMAKEGDVPVDIKDKVDTTLENAAKLTDDKKSAQDDDKTDKTPPTEPKKLKWKLKVDGQEEEVELSEEDIKRDYQRMKASNKRFEEAHSLRQNTEAFLQQLGNKDYALQLLAEKYGYDVNDLATEVIARQIQMQQMTPQERALYEKDQELAKYKQDKERQAQEDKNKQSEVSKEKYRQEYESLGIEVLEQQGIPKNRYTMQRFAYHLANGVKHGIDYDAKELGNLIRQDYQNEFKTILGDADAKTILKMFGEELLSKIRKYDLEQAKSKQPKFNTPKVNQGSPEALKGKKSERNPNQYISSKDIFKR